MLPFSNQQIHIDIASDHTQEEKKEDVDFFKDHTSNVRAFGDSPNSTPPRVESPARLGARSAGTPPRVDSGSKLSSLAKENGSSPLTVKTEPGL